MLVLGRPDCPWGRLMLKDTACAGLQFELGPLIHAPAAEGPASPYSFHPSGSPGANPDPLRGKN